MKMLVVSLVAALLGGSAASAQASADPKAAVSRLLQSINTNDASIYAEVGPQLVMMATPDFGVPMSFDKARKTFGRCALTSLSDPRPVEAVPASIVTAAMTCDPPLSAGPVTFDFLADGKLVYAIYPGGIGRFYPKFAKTPSPGSGP